MPQIQAMSKETFILIHGSWHAGWCFDKIKPLLEDLGHRVLAPDLPSHGKDKTPIKEVTLQSYTDCITKLIDEQTEPVILVGHSRGGIVISQVAEYRPEKIKKLIYLTAFLIPSGEAMLPTALSDKDSLIVKNLEVNEQEGWHMLKKEAAREALYHDCSEEDANWAISRLEKEPNAPVSTSLSLTEANYGRVPRFYIECLQDKGLSPSLQKKMYTAQPCQKVISMNSSHSPFLSAPDELVTKLTFL